METKIAALHQSKNIALVAHDNMKPVLCEWVKDNRTILSSHTLYATGTTGYQLEEVVGTSVSKFLSGPLGGDQQIGAKIAEGLIDVLIFFWDPFEPMPHDPDVKALLRVAACWNIPIASSPATADHIITSPLIQQEYKRAIPDYERYIEERVGKF